MRLRVGWPEKGVEVRLPDSSALRRLSKPLGLLQIRRSEKIVEVGPPDWRARAFDGTP